MRVLTAAAVVAVLGAAITVVAGAGSSNSGLFGKVSRGPTLPVCVQTRPCQEAASVTLAFSRRGTRVADARSSRTGDYRVALAPGVYTVTPAFPHPLWHVSPRSVRVAPGGYRKLNFLIDTGIR
jgi:hypothetical protein